MPLTFNHAPWPPPYVAPTGGGAGGYWPGRYWARRYWGQRYWGGNTGIITPPVPTISLREAMVAGLLADSGISALVGARVFPGVVPQNQVLPAIAWQIITIPRRVNLTLNKPATIVPARVQFSAVSKLLPDTMLVSEAIRQAFQGFTGPLTSNGPWIVETVLVDERDMNEDQKDGTGRAVFRTVLDYLFRYRETPPSRLI